MNYAELRNGLATRGLHSPGGSKDDLQHRLLANDKSRFDKYGPLSDPEGSLRATLIRLKSEEVTKRAETRHKTQIARANGAKEVQLEKIEEGRKQELAVLKKIIAEEKEPLALGGRVCVLAPGNDSLS